MAVWRQDNINRPFQLRGSYYVSTEGDLAVDEERTDPLEFGTLLSQNLDNQWRPLREVVARSAFLTGGASSADLAAWKAVTDGKFSLALNGVTREYTGLDFAAAASMSDVRDIIHAAVTAHGIVAFVSTVPSNRFQFWSTATGRGVEFGYADTVAGLGTDISGPVFLACSEASGATLDEGEGEYPMGIYVGGEISAEEIAAGITENIPVAIKGIGSVLDKGLIIRENGADWTDRVMTTHMTLETFLRNELDFVVKDTEFLDELAMEEV
jgi:hypothetical protein